jgi:hypothetical protein
MNESVHASGGDGSRGAVRLRALAVDGSTRGLG